MIKLPGVTYPAGEVEDLFRKRQNSIAPPEAKADEARKRARPIQEKYADALSQTQLPGGPAQAAVPV